MNAAAKLALLSRVVLAPAIWGENAERWSRGIPHDFPGDFAAHLKHQCESGPCEVREIVADGAPVGFLVFEIDHIPECPPELVIHAMAGRDGSDLSEAVAPRLLELARELSCRTVRFHTMRPGLVKKARQLGFHVSEIVLRADA